MSQLRRVQRHFNEVSQPELSRQVGEFEEAVRDTFEVVQQEIADLEEKVDEGGGGGCECTALDVSYDNSGSGLVAINVQEAIDELDADVNAVELRVDALEAASPSYWRGRVTDSQSVVSGADYSLTSIDDDGGGWVVDASGIKVPSAGVYFASWNARFSYNGSAVGDFISSAFRNQSGTQLARNGDSQDNGSNLVTFTVTRTFTVTDAATFRFRIYNDGAPTVTVSGNVTLNALDIIKVGS